MRSKFDNVCDLTNTNNDQIVEAEVDNFREKESLDAYIATNKIKMRWNGRVYVGNAHGMEFTSLGPKEHVYKEGRR
tara:strand:+ start:261 stop:488 length:228 start_codon:yes stop_codon:yes gene_type:complete